MAIHLRPAVRHASRALMEATSLVLPLAGPLVGITRIDRHPWRMCLGLTFAAGSAFTNDLPRLLPQSAHIRCRCRSSPKLAPLLVLPFWLARTDHERSREQRGQTRAHDNMRPPDPFFSTHEYVIPHLRRL